MYYSTKYNVQTVVKVFNSIYWVIGWTEVKSKHWGGQYWSGRHNFNNFNNYTMGITLQCIVQQNSIFKLSQMAQTVYIALSGGQKSSLSIGGPILVWSYSWIFSLIMQSVLLCNVLFKQIQYSDWHKCFKRHILCCRADSSQFWSLGGWYWCGQHILQYFR
jgi:hypothetical protein